MTCAVAKDARSNVWRWGRWGRQEWGSAIGSAAEVSFVEALGFFRYPFCEVLDGKYTSTTTQRASRDTN